jgi:hypothetical protein
VLHLHQVADVHNVHLTKFVKLENALRLIENVQKHLIARMDKDAYMEIVGLY